jgi:hypothetical protein
MLRLKYLTAACLLAMTIGSADATTSFDWTLAGDPSFGIIGHGTLTANLSGGQYAVDSISGIVSDSCAGGPPCLPQYRNIIGLLTPHQGYASLSDIGGDNLIFPAPASPFLDSQGLVFSIGGIGSDPCPFPSGCYMNIFYSPNPYGGAPWFTPQYALYVSNAGANPVDFELTAVSATPLPSTWLMLLSGFVGLGFFAYRGTKKDSATLAAA